VTAALLSLGDWLAALGLTRMVIEATYAYWRPPFYLLEDRFETWLVNAKDVKHPPGRPKTDRLDATGCARSPSGRCCGPASCHRQRSGSCAT
jgi:hypothetical protein